MDKSLDALSGPWAGFWLQYGQRGFMRLDLVFASGVVSGTGDDKSGTFTMKGVYGSEAIEIIKGYDQLSIVLCDAAPVLLYEGRWDGAVVFGRWVQEGDPWNTGEFEMWPVSGETAMEELLQELEVGEQRPLVTHITF
ncbi:MAG: hypothetical protein KF884_02085 [Fimbriimonadaceae bacterium]|nr:hypothetical protein [Fimbriimonadaceae bacterium]QYK58884.1 MAG: hypothetical protein KF884_02085 [Fimbriimonadaceae bacterium]